MATKNNRRTIITKKILRETLLELLQEKSISKITIKEICDLSEMSRSTFYLHYQDQFMLLEDLENELIQNIMTTLGTLDSVINSMDGIIAFLKIIKSNPKTYRTLLCKNESKSFQEKLIEIVEKTVQSNTPIDLDPQKKDYLFTFIMYGSLNVITEWINHDYDIAENELAELIFTSCNNIAISTLA